MKKPSLIGRFYHSPGNGLLSRGPGAQVSSALKGLTSVFEMRTGVTPSLEPPGQVSQTKLAHQPDDDDE